MKKCVLSIMGIIAVIILGVVLVDNKKDENLQGYLRVHIRANSNSYIDQSIKMQVKQSIVDYLTPKLSSGDSFEKAYNILSDNLKNIEDVANTVLKENGFTYTSKAKLNEEFFPTRSYGEFTLNEGFYDALIIELGSGEGNNWWCVVYPPLCFIGSEGSDYSNIKYKSKIVEIIQNFFN